MDFFDVPSHHRGGIDGIIWGHPGAFSISVITTFFVGTTHK
jgi:hypothetical protein